MQFRRSLLLVAVPAAACCAVAVPALAAVTPKAATPKVSFRIEGTSRTLLAARTVTPPSSGSVTVGGAPAGACSSDSAAGALNLATHGHWDGKYDSGLGIEVTSILGTTPAYDNGKGSYWEFFVNDRAASSGVCATTLKAGDSLLFAQVPASGKAELPLVVSAPKTVKAGQPFAVKTFVYQGKGNATTLVKAHFSAVHTGGSARSANLGVGATNRRGVTELTLKSGATYSLTASATGEIRSAAVTIKVVR